MSFTKIAILGDSLALPRPGDGLCVDEIYPTLLAMEPGFLVFTKAKSSADTDFHTEAEQIYHGIKYLDCDYHIVHLGICDCSPRIFTKFEKTFLQMMIETKVLARLAHIVIGLRSRARMYHTKRRMIQCVPIARFRANMAKIIGTALENPALKKIILINIAAPGPHLTERSYGVAGIIDQYNRAIAEIAASYAPGRVEVIDMHDFTTRNPGCILKDGHHVDASAHRFVHDAVLKIVNAGAKAQAA